MDDDGNKVILSRDSTGGEWITDVIEYETAWKDCTKHQYERQTVVNIMYSDIYEKPINLDIEAPLTCKRE